MNRFTIQELLVPFAQTTHFCGMQYLERSSFTERSRMTWRTARTPTALDYRRALTALRDGTLDLDALSRIDT